MQIGINVVKESINEALKYKLSSKRSLMGVADWLKPAESNQERSGWPKLVTA
jgi:hypothetical protein